MRTGIAAALAAAALALAAGCGSSSKSTAGTGADTSGGTSSSASAGTGTGTSPAPSKAATTSAGASIKVDTAPKFASPSKSAPVQSGLVQIAYRNISIEPDTVRVKVGTTIRWTNYDSVQANVVSVSGPQRFASKNFGEGGTFEVKLTKPGVIHYECTLYPVTMNGTIEVLS
jgi:plastocyanin